MHPHSPWTFQDGHPGCTLSEKACGLFGHSFSLSSKKKKKHIIVSRIAAQKSPDTQKKNLFQASFSSSISFSEICKHYDFLHFRSNKNAFEPESLRKQVWRHLNAAESLLRVLTNCFMKRSFKCNGGDNTFSGSINCSCLALCLPVKNLVFYDFVLLVVMCYGIWTVPNTDMTWKLGKTSLETHNFLVYNFPALQFKACSKQFTLL